MNRLLIWTTLMVWVATFSQSQEPKSIRLSEIAVSATRIAKETFRTPNSISVIVGGGWRFCSADDCGTRLSCFKRLNRLSNFNQHRWCSSQQLDLPLWSEPIPIHHCTPQFRSDRSLTGTWIDALRQWCHWWSDQRFHR